MRRLILVLGIAVGAIALVFGGIAVLSEAAEVVVLQTSDATGQPYTTRLWVVDDAGKQWLRAGNPDSRWYHQLVANPEVSLTRGDSTKPYTAVALQDAAARDRVNALMAEKYATADRLIGLMADRTVSVPVRLDPR